MVISRIVAALAFMVAVVCYSPATAGAQPQRFGEMTLFSGANFTGSRYTVTGPRENIRLPWQVRSVRASPGEEWQVCTQTGYRGACTTILGSRNNLNQLVGSARPFGQPARRDEITFFSARSFTGNRLTVTGPTPNLRMRFRPRSIQIAPGDRWQICPRTNYRGACQILDTSTASTQRTIASVRPMRGAWGEQRISFVCERGPGVDVIFGNGQAWIVSADGSRITLRQDGMGANATFMSPTHSIRRIGNDIIFTEGRAAPMRCRPR